jgi:hypothetical protein
VSWPEIDRLGITTVQRCQAYAHAGRRELSRWFDVLMAANISGLAVKPPIGVGAVNETLTTMLGPQKMSPENV